MYGRFWTKFFRVGSFRKSASRQHPGLIHRRCPPLATSSCGMRRTRITFATTRIFSRSPSNSERATPLGLSCQMAHIEASKLPKRGAKKNSQRVPGYTTRAMFSPKEQHPRLSPSSIKAKPTRRQLALEGQLSRRHEQAGRCRPDTCGREQHPLLNETLLTSLAQARAVLAAWKDDYNNVRPHSSLVRSASSRRVNSSIAVLADRNGTLLIGG
jgi:transposase InsO family protein